mmetsp:Transcript_20060/g.34512  ORF Transcript_20060/g.34512 Transcript_20060/m.34512 type:complete len:331 (-) Transcript_20060:445-1437(-)
MSSCCSKMFSFLSSSNSDEYAPISDISSHDGRVAELFKQAEKKLNNSSFFSGEVDFSEVAELYSRAANLLKASKQWRSAAETYVKKAECLARTEEKHEFVGAYADAASCFKKADLKSEAVRCLKTCIAVNMDQGRCGAAAKKQKELAEMLEGDAENIGESPLQSESSLAAYRSAIEAFQLAADYFHADDNANASSQCNVKIAQLKALIADYGAAARLFEEAAERAVENNLLKWSAKDYLLSAGVCRLLADACTAPSALHRFGLLDPLFAESAERRFLNAVCTAVDEQDVDAFMGAVSAYDATHRLDQWSTTMLVRVKRAILASQQDPDIR